MGKTFIQLLEVAAVVGAQFVPGLNVVVAGVAISSAAVATIAVVGIETVLNATVLAPKSPKAATTEAAFKPFIERSEYAPAATIDSLDDLFFNGGGLGRRPGVDDLFEIDQSRRVYA